MTTAQWAVVGLVLAAAAAAAGWAAFQVLTGITAGAAAILEILTY